MNLEALLENNPIDWLLENDEENPSIRYFTLVNLLEEDENSKIVSQARQALMQSGPIPIILSNQHSDGYWVEPGSGYRPKYRSTVWSLIMLAQLGADRSNSCVKKACHYVLDNARAKQGCFSIYRGQSGAVHCLQGNLTSALIDLGFLDDPRLSESIIWMVRSVTGEGFGKVGEKNVHPHYIRSGISGPDFLCSANDHQPCAWGAVKVATALSKIPLEERTPQINKAVKASKDFLISKDPSIADYPHPHAKKPSSSWFKFGFPVFYVTDLLQNLSALIDLGMAGEEKLINAIEFINTKQDTEGKWTMEYTYNGKTWVDIEEKRKPSKWMTYRALSILKRFYTKE